MITIVKNNMSEEDMLELLRREHRAYDEGTELDWGILYRQLEKIGPCQYCKHYNRLTADCSLDRSTGYEDYKNTNIGCLELEFKDTSELFQMF